MCTHGNSIYSELECQYSCSHHTTRHLKPEQVLSSYLDTQKHSYRVNKSLKYVQLDQTYGDGKGDKYDFFGYDPENHKLTGRPLFMFVHGGYWQEGTREVFTAGVKPLVEEANAAVAVIDYDLADVQSIDQMVQQVGKAVKFFNDKSQKESAKGLYLLGHSAGAQLIAMAVAKAFRPMSQIRGLFLVSGIYDLDPLIDTYIGKPLRLTPEIAYAVSPINFHSALKARCSVGDVFVMLIVGSEESEELIAQTAQMHAKAFINRNMEMSIEKKIIKSTDHFTIIENLQNTDDPLMKLIINKIK